MNLAVSSSVTRNEAAHIAAGLAAWQNGDVWLYCVNPPLSKMVAVLPLVLSADVPTRCLDTPRRKGARLEFLIGNRLSRDCGFRFHEYVIYSRIAGLMWLWAGGLLLYSFGSRLYNEVGGAFATCLWACDPLVTAHGALATPDIPVTVAVLLTVSMAYRLLFINAGNRAGPGVPLILGICTGFAALVKFTGLLCVPIVTAMSLVRATARLPSVWQATRQATVFLTVIVGVMWVGYGFDSLGTTLSDLDLQSEAFTSFPGVRLLVDSPAASYLPHVLPASFVVGLDLQQCDFEGAQCSYVRGMTSNTGWPWYYVYALAVKCPLGHLFLFIAGAVVMATRLRCIGYTRAATVLIPIVVILGTASTKYGFTNHVRYVLPAMPFLYLLAACPTIAFDCEYKNKLAAGIMTSTILLSLVSVANSYPHLLGYFNRAAGGINLGWWHLDDSNIDWGQDIIRLQQWLDKQPGSRRFATDIHHYVDLHTYLGPRCVPLGDATHVIVDAYTLVHALPELNADKAKWRIGASLFIFEKGDYIMPINSCVRPRHD